MQRSISIWFFCGALMLLYGLVLLVQGVHDLHTPPATVLANLHPTLCWGVLLTICGGVYSIRFKPSA